MARDMILTGRRLTAAEALEHGLVSLVVADRLLDGVVQDVAIGISIKGRQALGAAKRSIVAALDRQQVDGFELESEEWAELFGSKDQKEGMKALLEKREPVFNER
jgi:enoyl-CoA hydratase/carnithine racemase